MTTRLFEKERERERKGEGERKGKRTERGQEKRKQRGKGKDSSCRCLVYVAPLEVFLGSSASWVDVWRSVVVAGPCNLRTTQTLTTTTTLSDTSCRRFFAGVPWPDVVLKELTFLGPHHRCGSKVPLESGACQAGTLDHDVCCWE